MTLAAVCALCESAMAPGDGAAAFRGRMAHLTCWLEWREGRRPAPRPSVLVVEDDEPMRYATRRMLQTAAFDVTEAGDAMSALHAIARRPDLVLLDLHLPDLDGFEVCRRIKTNPETAWMRVLPFTAVFRDEADRQRAFDVGADGYLVKPIGATELIATVNALLRVA